MAPLGFIAVIAGWTTTEVGRQPWTVYGLLRTADSVTPSLTAADVVLSLACHVVVYLIMFPTGIAFMVGIMLLALVFRGVAFEFRFKQRALRRFWDGAFCGGAILATFAQGVVLGTFIQGFKVDGRHFTGTSFDWVSPFPLAIGLALIFGYSLLGCGVACPKDRR